MDRESQVKMAINGMPPMTDMVIISVLKSETLLHEASRKNMVDKVKQLIVDKVNINSKNHQGQNILHCAAQNNHVNILHFVHESLEGFDIDAVEKEGQTAVHVAASCGQGDVLKKFLLSGIEVDDRDTKEMTPLHMAAQEGHIDVVTNLLDHGCNINSQNYQGNTALHLAASNNHTTVVSKLVNVHQCEINLVNKCHVQCSYQPPQSSPNSYKEHGYRLLLIWLHGIKKEDNPVKQLFEALIAIGRRELAEQIRRKCNFQVERSTSTNSCVVS
ncbi:hypothetical protein LSH36_79g10001 [Paralvinella palmiformis]|uniref:Uncharacterized protein n=1 Tax=Paralvinella palmiformis TaxID=53620 RepID=A0AAD9NCF8_9ANNE|nr:hypothetical protein LSH36_79g10001 [Paralvinella palmiformis]